jgi:hypothetical protein
MMIVTTLFNYVRDDWEAKVVMECVIRHVPWCICHCSEYLRLEPLYDVDVVIEISLYPMWSCNYHSSGHYRSSCLLFEAQRFGD